MFSVFIPALNEEKFIGDCLESLTNQERSEDLEIIVLDNGSEDKTREIAEEYCDKLFFEPEKELFELCNKGIKEASGDIVSRVDADCIVMDEWLREAKKSLNDSVLVNGTILPREDSRFYKFILHLYNMIMRISINSFYFATAIGGNCAFYKSIAKKAGGFKDYFPSDGKFGLDMRQFGKVTFNPNMKARTSMRRYKKGSYGQTGLELLITTLKLRWGSKRNFREPSYWSEENQN